MSVPEEELGKKHGLFVPPPTAMTVLTGDHFTLRSRNLFPNPPPPRRPGG